MSIVMDVDPELAMVADLPAADVPRGPVELRPRFAWLAFLALLGSLASIPYQRTILEQLPSSSGLSLGNQALLMGALVQFVVILLPTIALGSWLGGRVGLTLMAPQAPGLAGIRSLVLRSIGAGLLTGSLLVLSLAVVPEEVLGATEDVRHPSPLESLLASFGAGTVEEELVRLGLMSALVFVGWKTFGGESLHPALVWPANVLAAACFGALHLPLAAAMGSLTPAIVAVVMLGNGAAGIVFGWLYWRRGLIAAMLAHFSTDIVLHVLPQSLAPYLAGHSG